jgi:hypothetical protein
MVERSLNLIDMLAMRSQTSHQITGIDTKPGGFTLAWAKHLDISRFPGCILHHAIQEVIDPPQVRNIFERCKGSELFSRQMAFWVGGHIRQAVGAA